MHSVGLDSGTGCSSAKAALTLRLLVNEQGQSTAAPSSRGDGLWQCPWQENWYHGTEMGQAQSGAGEEEK